MRQLAALLVLFALAISSLPLPLAAEELLIEEEVVVTQEVEEKSPDEFVPIESPIPEVLGEVQEEEKSQSESTPDDECVPENTECLDTTGVEESIPEPESFQTFLAPLVALVEEPEVSGTVLSASIPENWDSTNWSSWDTIRVDIGKSQHLRDEGVVTHMTLMLRDTSNDPNRPVSFTFTGAFDRAYDCTTPFKTVAEWGIPSGLEYGEVTIGPFTGTQCDLRLRALPFFAGQFTLAARKTDNTFDTKFAIPYPSAFIAYAAHIPGGTRITTDLTSDTIFKSKESYLISGKVTVEEGVTVTVEPGAVVKFDTRSSLEVNGTLIANGTQENPVYFTSFKDDAGGGDLNSDGDASLPNLGDWESLTANFPTGNVFIENAIVRYGGTQMLSGAEGNLSVRNSSITNSNRGVWNYRSGSGSPLAFDNNWWGDSSGPRDGAQYQGGGTFIGPWVTASPWLTEDPFLDSPCIESCVSNVLFLPGIKGSRLYDESDELLWEPEFDLTNNDNMRSLFLDQHGQSKNNVVVKEGDVLDTVAVSRYYASLIEAMDLLKEEGTIENWAPVAYDWRLSLDDLLDKGAQDGDQISYLTSTSTPYIEQTLRALAKTSKTKRVTIIAHSNGGLLAKALIHKLGNAEAEQLIDKMVFVGVPQSGAPQAVGALLYGYGEGIPREVPFLVSTAVARELAENSPMGYHLLPSQSYFSSVQDARHPVGIFNAEHTYQSERVAYGQIIANEEELHDFLLAKEGGRAKPSSDDIASANVLNSELLAYAKSTHDALDAWTPPENISVYQIAGWGVDTVAGIEFKDSPALFSQDYKPIYLPIFTEDGDGVVPVPSALMMNSGEVKRYWLNLLDYNDKNDRDRNHADILEVAEVLTLFESILLGSNSTPDFIEVKQPPARNERKKLYFFLHSPLTLELYDEAGNHLGLNKNGSFDDEIKGARYGEFGEVKFITALAGQQYKVMLRGQDEGTFSLDIQEVENGEVVTSTSVANVPSTANTLVSLSIKNGIKDASSLALDKDGDGAVDIEVALQEGSATFYEEPILSSNTETESSSGGGNKNFAKSIPSAPTVNESSTPPELQNLYLNPPPPFIPENTYIVPSKAKNDDSTSEEVQRQDFFQTASAYNAIESSIQWLGEVLYTFLRRTLNLIGIKL